MRELPFSDNQDTGGMWSPWVTVELVVPLKSPMCGFVYNDGFVGPKLQFIETDRKHKGFLDLS
jgi:hypothetical protein